MTDFQDHRMRKLLLDLEMLSHGSTQAWNKAGGKSVETPDPPGESRPPHDTFREQYEACKSDGGRERVIEAASDELEAMRKGNLERFKVKGESPEELAARIVRDFAGWPARMVADKVRTTVMVVRSARKGARLDEESGDPSKGVPKIDNEERAVKMRERGLSFRAIEMNTGIPKSTVERLCNRRAA